MVNKQELEQFKTWFNKNIGTEWEVGYTECVPDGLKDKYSDLYSLSLFDLDNEDFRMVQDYEIKHITDKDVLVELFDEYWDKHLFRK